MQAAAALPPTARPGLFRFHFSFSYFLYHSRILARSRLILRANGDSGMHIFTVHSRPRN
jgi:hypothetical protein